LRRVRPKKNVGGFRLEAKNKNDGGMRLEVGGEDVFASNLKRSDPQT
jgi:hypothetical protein